MDDQTYHRASEVLERLQSELDAIAAAEPGSDARRRAITRYTAVYAELGRLRVA